MTAYPKHAFDVAPGNPQPTVFAPLALFFRPLLRLVGRKPAVPGNTPPGAAPALVADGDSFWDDKAPRHACCAHCDVPTACDPPDSHPVACSVGCNKPARNDVTAPSGLPVLGGAMLADVREQWNAWHDDSEPSAPAPWRPSSAMDTGEFAALDAKVDAAMSARYLPVAPELAGGLRRPVNGRNLGTRPRAYGQAPQLEVERDAYLAEEAAEAVRADYVRSQMRGAMAARDEDTLRQVLTGLRKL